MKKLLFLLLVGGLLGCQADPAQKKIPFEEKKLVAKGVNIDFFPAVDILFVVDDSGSMNQFQQILSKNSEEFVATIFNTRFIDYHIGVTTSTSTANSSSRGWGGRLVNDRGFSFVERDTPEGQEVLADYLRVGTNGAIREIFFEVIDSAFSPALRATANKDFFREDAHLLIFFVTDTDDQGVHQAPYIFDLLKNLKKGQTDKISMVGALLTHNIQSCRRPGGEYEPAKLSELVGLFKGKIFNLCANDYGEPMALVAEEILRRTSTIQLTQIPVLETLKLTYGRQIIPRGINGWTYDPQKNQIYLSPEIELAPERKGTRVKVNFKPVY